MCDTIVNRMGHIWREQAVSDVGIDGQIELVDPATHAATGRILMVQSKATASPLDRENDESFVYRCRQKDIDYWMSASVPVLLVVSHVEREESWFKNLHEWFADPIRRESRLVEFDKTSDRFDSQASQLLTDSGAPRSSGAYLQPAPRAEDLTSNLIKVDVPRDLFVAPSEAQGWTLINRRLREAGERTVDDVAWSGGNLYSFRPFDRRPLACLADAPQEVFATEELQCSSDEADQRLLVRLLNNTLREQLRPRLRWNRDRGHFHFPATPDLSGLKLKVRSGSSGRTVFEPYTDKRDPSVVSHYRHYAARLRFVDLDGEWFVSIEPTYHFTKDGLQESRIADKLLSGIKKLEGHDAVRHLTVFWATFLSGEDGSLFAPDDDLITFRGLAQLHVEHGIDDGFWKPRPENQIELPDSSSDGQLSLQVDS